MLNWRCDSKCQTENMALKAKLKRYGGFELQTEKDKGFEHHNWELTSLNIKLRKTNLNVVNKKQWWLWTSSYNEMVALNAKLKRDGGSERPNWEEMVALNAEL